jgi:NAD(P)-dependent dehydrogenase (short-subunit alcohol dehydrogenase family)
MTDSPTRLAGKVAVVTGGGSGIGRAAAIRFAAEGAHVLVADIAADRAGAVAGEIADGGGRAAAMVVDVSDPAQVEAMAARAVSEFGGIDVLMTAAGVLSFGSVTETDPQAWNRVIGINLTGTFLASRAVIPAMERRGGGAIVTVSSSTGAHDASPGNVAYVASKGGVAMLTKAMAVDHAPQGIRVNAIAPGPTATPMLGSVMTDDEMRRFGEAMPIGRLAQPAELAAAAAFLASDDASYVTGAVFAVDGGQTAKVG